MKENFFFGEVVDFEDLYVGNKFMYEQKGYIKIETINDGRCEKGNAVCLDDGVLCCFDFEDEVVFMSK